MRLSHRLARLEDAAGLPHDGPTFASGRLVTDEERCAAAERLRAALVADVADLVAEREEPTGERQPLEPDLRLLERWSVQHGLAPEAERSQIVAEVLRELTDEELDSLEDVLAPVERRP